MSDFINTLWNELTTRQVRALASQNKIPEWKTESIAVLKRKLEALGPDILEVDAE